MPRHKSTSPKKNKKRVKSLRNVITGKIKKGDMLVSIRFEPTEKNKWTVAKTKKFVKDYNIKVSSDTPDVVKDDKKITSITFPIRDKKEFKKFKIKKNIDKDITIKIGNKN